MKQENQRVSVGQALFGFKDSALFVFISISVFTVCGLCLFYASSAYGGNSVRLGSATRTTTQGLYLYQVPIRAQIDGYSTLQASFRGNSEIVDYIESEIVGVDIGKPLLVFSTPRHLDNYDVQVTVDYQGRSHSKTYGLAPTKVAYGNDHAVPSGCARQWIVPGTLLNNVTRILAACNRSVGLWPMENGQYLDFRITVASPLQRPGELKDLLAFVEKNYGLQAKITNSESGVIDFTDISLKITAKERRGINQ